ncbi:hypothetical protein QUB68_24430 [Microcoleus sp. A006_D1]|uniref:hypothetical protein n=1 Tax=Microcoleus sp. A006_D1 TaxID=3055267 RepID=UPI002FD6BF25
MIDVTGRKETFAELAQLLNVEKFGILDSDREWSYLGLTEQGGFAWSNGIAGWAEPVLPHFPEQTNESPQSVVSKTVWEDGIVQYANIVKVFAYD